MKKRKVLGIMLVVILAISVLLWLYTDSVEEYGSSVQLPDLTSEKIDDLELLGRVWGFLKYHHPEVAKGKYNWDQELFEFLPAYLEAGDTAERDKLLVEWVDSFGEIEEHACEPVDENAFIKPDLEWIEQQSENLKNKLFFVYNNRLQRESYYVETNGNRNPIFKHEDSYKNISFPDDGYRLLSLYRYWNMINYFFPYKYLMDEDWDGKLKEYIPKFVNAKDELAYELSALEIIGDVQDTHANIWGGGDKINRWKGLNYSPVHLRFIENKLVVTDYYDESLKVKVGLKIGDIITKINGRPVEDIVKEKSKYYPASNEPTRLRDIAEDILRSSSQSIEIEFVSENSEPQTKTLKLYPRNQIHPYHLYPEIKGKCYKMLDNNIGYITLQNIEKSDISKIRRKFKDTRGIVIDIRNYPSTYVPYLLGSYFISSPTPFVKFTHGSVDNPGEFTFTPNEEIRPIGKTYQGKLVVLVNELSQSQSEYTAMAFRAGDNTTIIGSTTAGADGNVSEIMLPGGIRTLISGLGVYYPDGGETQRIGIIPDIEVKPTIQGIREGRDELLEKAIEVILEN